MAGVQDEMASFVTKFQQLCYEGFNANLNFTSYQGSVYVHCNVNLGQLPPDNGKDKHRKNCMNRKPSRIRRRRKREEQRNSQQEKCRQTESLLDLEVPILQEDSDVMDFNTENEEAITSADTDSNLIENSFSSVSPYQECRPEDNLNMSCSKATSAPEDFKYWEHFYAMLKYLTEKNSSMPTLTLPRGSRVLNEMEPSHVSTLNPSPTFYQR